MGAGKLRRALDGQLCPFFQLGHHPAALAVGAVELGGLLGGGLVLFQNGQGSRTQTCCLHPAQIAAGANLTPGGIQDGFGVQNNHLGSGRQISRLLVQGAGAGAEGHPLRRKGFLLGASIVCRCLKHPNDVAACLGGQLRLWILGSGTGQQHRCGKENRCQYFHYNTPPIFPVHLPV